jgi:hypothetical protein
MTLRFDDFRKRARDQILSPYEKIGFPDAYRQGKEEAILRDILGKLRNLGSTEKTVVDIGPGCSNLRDMLIELCRRNRHQLILIDCQEMLDHLPDEPFIVKVPGRYPDKCRWLFEQYAGKVDVVLCYSVLHHMFGDRDIYSFLDFSLGLLAEGAEMLIEDVPNISKRKRFFSSPVGIRFHREFTGRVGLSKRNRESFVVCASPEPLPSPERPAIPLAKREGGQRSKKRLSDPFLFARTARRCTRRTNLRDVNVSRPKEETSVAVDRTGTPINEQRRDSQLLLCSLAADLTRNPCSPLATPC